MTSEILFMKTHLAKIMVRMRNKSRRMTNKVWLWSAFDSNTNNRRRALQHQSKMTQGHLVEFWTPKNQSWLECASQPTKDYCPQYKRTHRHRPKVPNSEEWKHSRLWSLLQSFFPLTKFNQLTAYVKLSNVSLSVILVRKWSPAHKDKSLDQIRGPRNLSMPHLLIRSSAIMSPFSWKQISANWRIQLESAQMK